MPPRRRSSRRSSKSISYVDSDDEVLDELFPEEPPHSSRAKRSAARSRASAATLSASPSPLQRRTSAKQKRVIDPDEDSDNGRIVPYDDDEDEVVQIRQPRLRARRSLSTAPPSRPATPSIVALSDAEPEAGPSRGHQRSRAWVDVPFLPLHRLEEYHLPRGLSLPTKESRLRLLAEQNAPARTLKLTPSKRKRQRSLSSDSGFGGYGDDTDDLHDEGEDEIDEWDDGSSSEGIPRRVTRQSGRRPEEEHVQTRSQRMRRNYSRVGSLPSSPIVSRSTATSSAMRGRRHERKRSPASPAHRPPSYEDPNFSEGEDEIDSFYGSSASSSPAPRATKAPTRRILEYHRSTCEKCSQPPANVLLEAARKKRKDKKKKVTDDDMVIGDVEHAESLGGWLEGCIPQGQRKKVIKARKVRYPDDPPIHGIAIDEVAIFQCTRCEAYPVCFVCKEESVLGAASHSNGTHDAPIDVDGDDAEAEAAPDVADKPPAAGTEPRSASAGNDDVTGSPPADEAKARSSSPANDFPSTIAPNLIPSNPAPLLFRCKRCKQASHYEHLWSPFPEGQKYSLPRLAENYQNVAPDGGNEWECHVCRDWPWIVDRVIAWRPLPDDAVEPELDPGELPNYRDRLPREYLIKWTQRGFRHTTWVTHGWLVAVAPQKLRNFIEKGPQLDLVTDDTLAAKGDEMVAPTITAVMEEHEATMRHHREKDDLETKWEGHCPPLDVDAQANLSVAWSTADRILDVWLFPPKNAKQRGKSKKKGRNRRQVFSSGSEEDELDYEVMIRDGIQPPESGAVWIDTWEEMTDRALTEDDLDEIAPLVTWSFVKWCDLQYDQACGDTPPPSDSPLYPAFKTALRRYLTARTVTIPVLTPKQRKERDDAAEHFGDPPQEQPPCVVGGKLMPFQLEGLQWLLYKHFRREGCILADDMGLGKTIQVASFLGYLASDEHKIYPSLVIVPNSTITNWVREFEKWVPHVRVVPYYGESASRKVIAKYELYHPGQEYKAEGLKAHVVLTTYDTITGADFRLFNARPRWETLVVDEGQAVKNNSSLLFQRLKKLNAVHRVLLTGTPLNNNLRELFNLLNFLDEPNFRHLKDLEERFEDLNENLVIELHEMLQPYILRRVKADVLKLPPKVEIIVPISMTPAQRHLYKRILIKYRDVINSILKQRKKKKPQAKKAIQAPRASTSGVVADVEMKDAEGSVAAVSSPDQNTSANGGPSAGAAVNGEPKANGAAEGTGDRTRTASEAMEPLLPANVKSASDAVAAALPAEAVRDMLPALSAEMDLD